MIAEPTQSEVVPLFHVQKAPTGQGSSRTVTKLVAVLALVLASFLPQLVTAPIANAAGAQLTAFDQEMIRLVNVKRTEAGLPAVEEASGLTQLSVWWSSQLADGATGYNLEHNPNAFQQVLSYGASTRTTWGENVAKWSPTSVTAGTIFEAYWNSPGHKANILGAAFRYVGMGSVTGANGTSWNTMTFTDKVDPGQVVPHLPGRDNPEGAFQASVRADGTIDVNGWAFDGSNLDANVDVFFYTNGSDSLVINANGPRPELGNYGISGNHGFVGRFPAKVVGNNEICMNVRNVGAGSDQRVQCTTVNLPANPARDNPVGALAASVSSAGTVSVNGWAFDPNSLYTPLGVMVTVNGQLGAALTANGPRPELAQFGVPGNHGFVASFAAPSSGALQVCLYAGNVGWGQSVWPQCVNLTYTPDASANPRGAFAASQSGSTISVNGWAFDQSDLYSPVTIMITVNGEVRTFASANGYRPELAQFGIPGNKGFVTSTTGTAGSDSVCMFAFNIGPGADQLIGCQNV